MLRSRVTPFPDAPVRNRLMFLELTPLFPQVVAVIEERAEFAGKEVPTSITKFYDTNDISCFSYDRRFNKTGGKIKGEF